MKKIISAAAAILTAVCCITSCSDTSNSSSEPSSSSRVRQKRVSSSKIDENIIGTWKNDFNGYRFQEDRNVSLVMDFSDTVHFTDDGKLIANEQEISGDMLTIENNTITAKIDLESLEEPATVLTLERIDGKNISDGLDGKYSMTDGTYKKAIASNFGLSPEQTNVEVDVRGEEFDITVVNYCLYETNDGKLELFSENMDYVDENANSVFYEYSIEGDTLTMTYETGEEEVYTKYEEK
ncbi:MAG: hypothetical protein J6I55_06055 [Ruminococcus sp.]|nr:hypothetical protein [Ruminococcus sp.]